MIQNRLGLHARAAALFVQLVAPLDVDVWVSKAGETVNGKSLYAATILRNKKIISINLRMEEGRALVRRLVPHFDVIVLNDRKSGGVVTAILQPLEAVKDNRRRVARADISNDAAHGGNPPVGE